jgi:hypothetical protein
MMHWQRSEVGYVAMMCFFLGLVWLPSFGAGIKEFIYDSNNYLFGAT